jgi:hypothetical protein
LEKRRIEPVGDVLQGRRLGPHNRAGIVEPVGLSWLLVERHDASLHALSSQPLE